MAERLDVWRVVQSGMGTLHEIETTWTLVDVWDACQYLDIQDDMRILALPPEARK